MHIAIASDPLFHIGSFTVTNTLFTSWIVVLGLIIVAFIFSRSIKTIPGRFQAFGEFVLEKFMD
ncbi:MAG: ATP synthase F0 subunit A, partial [Candidatus Paceibacterota bacterium]